MGVYIMIQGVIYTTIFFLLFIAIAGILYTSIIITKVHKILKNGININLMQNQFEYEEDRY